MHVKLTDSLLLIFWFLRGSRCPSADFSPRLFNQANTHQGLPSLPPSSSSVLVPGSDSPVPTYLATCSPPRFLGRKSLDSQTSNRPFSRQILNESAVERCSNIEPVMNTDDNSITDPIFGGKDFGALNGRRRRRSLKFWIGSNTSLDVDSDARLEDLVSNTQIQVVSEGINTLTHSKLLRNQSKNKITASDMAHSSDPSASISESTSSLLIG
jgi:hypothetical protein